MSVKKVVVIPYDQYLSLLNKTGSEDKQLLKLNKVDNSSLNLHEHPVTSMNEDNIPEECSSGECNEIRKNIPVSRQTKKKIQSGQGDLKLSSIAKETQIPPNFSESETSHSTDNSPILDKKISKSVKRQPPPPPGIPVLKQTKVDIFDWVL